MLRMAPGQLHTCLPRWAILMTRDTSQGNWHVDHVEIKLMCCPCGGYSISFTIVFIVDM